MPQQIEFTCRTSLKGMPVEVEATVYNDRGRRTMGEVRIYLEDGKRADWLLTKCPPRAELAFAREVIAASYG